MKPLRAIVLAAGKGTRMRSERPKVLHTVCGRPMIQYVLDVVRAVGSVKICVVLGHQAAQVRTFLGQGSSSVIQKSLLGTADAVRCAASAFRGYTGDVLIICGDTPLLRKETLAALVKAHRRSSAACTVLTAVVDDPRGYGRIVRGTSGEVQLIREDKDATEHEKTIREINVGLYCFHAPALFKALARVRKNPVKGEYYLTDVVEILAGSGSKVESVTTEEPSEGLGVNSQEDLAVAENVIRRRVLKGFMAQGVTIRDPETTYIDADVRIGTDTVIKPFVVIENNVRIGNHCSVGPFTHLRPGTQLADRVEIGNFAEVSRSSVGERSLMKHFGFLGDAAVGRHVNIGAGTVTANYDGRNKNKTTVKDRAFIGSDSILVAPVTVGKGAVTGAGCVVKAGTKVPDNGVVVGVPARPINRKKN